MKRWIYKLYLWLTGWKVDKNTPKEAQRCVMIAAPHTSNWDFPYTMLAFRVMKIPQRYTIKKSWLKFPQGLLFKYLGAVGIDRSRSKDDPQRKSYIDQMVEIIQKHERIAMVITPEGSRQPNDTWKMGFYYTALKAKVPICLGFIDYSKKLLGVGKCLMPTGDIEADMKEIMCFYKDITGKFPENFLLDHRYPCPS